MAGKIINSLKGIVATENPNSSITNSQTQTKSSTNRVQTLTYQ